MSRLSLVSLWLLVIAAAVVSPAVLGSQARSDAQRVRHVVVFEYTPDATPAQIQKVTDAFRALATSIPGIVGFEDGVNNSPEGKNQRFTHIYLLTFESVAARDAYLPHPAHAAFGKTLRGSGIFVNAFVVDYVPNVTK